METKLVNNCCAAGHFPSKEQKIIFQNEKNRKGSTKNMIQLAGGNFLMGADDKEGFPEDGEGR